MRNFFNVLNAVILAVALVACTKTKHHTTVVEPDCPPAPPHGQGPGRVFDVDPETGDLTLVGLYLPPQAEPDTPPGFDVVGELDNHPHAAD